MWVVVEAISGRIIGAWTDVYEAKGAAQAWEEEEKVDCLLIRGKLEYGAE